MRIITSSKLKDYYDRFSDPRDNHTVWVREQEGLVHHPVFDRYASRRLEVFAPVADAYFLSENDPLREVAVKKQGDFGPFDLNHDDRFYIRPNDSAGKFRYGYEPLYVVFCGIMYRGIVYYEEVPLDKMYSVRTRYRCYWTLEQFAADHMLKKDKGKNSKMNLMLEGIGKPAKTPAEVWFVPIDTPDVIDACVTLNTPVVMGLRRKPYDRTVVAANWMKNAVGLDTIQFFKLFDPTIAFQELDMFVGGVMVKTDKVAPVTDNIKILSHGMDAMSFRKDPTKLHR